MIWSGTYRDSGKSQSEKISPLLQICGMLLDFVFPIYCAGCRITGTHCCNECRTKFHLLKDEIIIQTERSKTIYSLFAAAEFKEKSPLAFLMHRFKYEGAREVGKILVDFFSDELMQKLYKIPKKIFVPVPLFPRRERQRGFNQSNVIANLLSNKVDAQVVEILNRVRFTEPQAQLNKEERRTNIRDAFEIDQKTFKKIPTDAHFFLIDDVYTTGATMNECAKVLHTAGVSRVRGIVIGRA